jgi:hypothetical protein
MAKLLRSPFAFKQETLFWRIIHEIKTILHSAAGVRLKYSAGID